MAAINSSINASLIPNELAGLLPNPRTPWHISQPLFDRMQKEGASAGAGAPSKPFKACPVTSSDPEFAFIMKYFNHSKPKNFGIRNIVCIHNSDASNAFEAVLLQTEKSAAGFPPSWQEEEPKAERAAAITRWRRQAEQFSPLYLKTAQRVEKLTATKVVPLWHGTSRAEAICSNGFAFFGKHALFKNANNTGPSTDIGYFGSGIYFTNNAQYATMYSTNKVGGTILLAWVAMREPFPVVSDQPVPREGTDMTMLKGKHAYKNYNAHYIPVTSTDPSDPENMQYHPCHRTEQPAWDEYVVFHSSQTLARFQIELGVDFPASPSPAVAAGPVKTAENLLDKILEMLDAPVIKEDAELAQLLTHKSAALTALDLVSPLSTQDQEIYGYTSKLLDAAGKPRNVIRQKLVQLLGSGPVASPAVAPPLPAASMAPAPGPAAAVPHTSAGPGPAIPLAKVMPPPAALPVPYGAGAGAAAAPSLVKAAPTIPEMAFGRAQWAKYFGDVGAEPPLPPDIQSILKSRCPIWPDKTVEQTHMLVLIPKTVNGKPWTLASAGELVKAPKTGHATCYRTIWEPILKEFGSVSVDRSHWVLMTRDVLSESRRKSYADQQKIVASYSQKAKVEYQVPNLIEAVTSLLMVYVDSGTRLFNDNPLTYTRCLEKVTGKSYQCVVGGFAPAGLHVSLNIDGLDTIGVGCLRKF